MIFIYIPFFFPVIAFCVLFGWILAIILLIPIGILWSFHKTFKILAFSFTWWKMRNNTWERHIRKFEGA